MPTLEISDIGHLLLRHQHVLDPVPVSRMDLGLDFLLGQPRKVLVRLGWLRNVGLSGKYAGLDEECLLSDLVCCFVDGGD